MQSHRVHSHGRKNQQGEMATTTTACFHLDILIM